MCLNLSSIERFKTKTKKRFPQLYVLPQEIITSVAPLSRSRYSKAQIVATNHFVVFSGCTCTCVYVHACVASIDPRRPRPASCASSFPSRNADLSPGISPSWCCCTIARRGTLVEWCTTDIRASSVRDATVYRFSVIPFASFSCRGPKEEQKRFQESLSVTCRDYGLRRKIVPCLSSRFLCGFHLEHETDRSTDPLIKTDEISKPRRKERCDACLCF